MTRIAICDDSRDELEQARKAVCAVCEAGFAEAEIMSFSDPEDLLREMSAAGDFDLYLLDVEMSQMDGFALARKIRQKSESGVIVFLTAYVNRAIEGYPVRAFGYVDKSAMQTTLPEVLKEALKEVEKEPRAITFHWNYDVIRVRISDIISVVSTGRTVEVTTTRESFRVNRRAHDIFEELHDPRFRMIDHGSFVNLNYVERVNTKDLRLMNGMSLPISRRARPQILSQLSKRWDVL